VASSYHSVPESLSEILAGARISQNDDEDEVNRAEEALPGLNLNDLDITSSDTSSSDSFLDISETSSCASDKWNASSPEQTEDKKSHCLWKCQKSGQFYACSSIRINLVILLIVLSLMVGRKHSNKKTAFFRVLITWRLRY